MDGGAVGYRKFHNGTIRMLKSFARGATLTLVSQGGSGVTYKLVNSKKTPYVNLSTGEKVHTVLIKFGVIDKSTDDYEINVAGRNVALSPLSKKEFGDEVAMQLRVLRHSAHICPSILMHRILKEADINDIFGSQVVLSGLPVSVIVMELVDDAVSLAKVRDKRFTDLARAKFLFLGAHGINHGDFHKNNLLLSPSKGELYVIDFGRASALSPENARLIAESVKAKDYVQGLRTLLMSSKITKDLVDPTPNKDLDLCVAQHWANTAEVNRAIQRLTEDGPFLLHYERFYGWVFSDDYLNLSKEDKKGITKEWNTLQAQESTHKFGREFRGSSLTSFGSALSTSNGGRTRRKRQTS